MPSLIMIPDFPFIPGLQLSRRFCEEAVKPILERKFPGLVYSAARLDTGSDVLGFDTPQSMDHGWGCRLTLYLSGSDRERWGDEILNALSESLPYEVAGIPTHFTSSDPQQGGLERITDGLVTHGVSIATVREYFNGYFAVEVTGEIGIRDWLILPEQKLRTLASGAVFHDGLGELGPLREKLAYYPHDLWLYLMACQWRKIDQEEPFMGRCGDVGDDLGSRIVAARLVHNLMRLCFYQERTYAPYSKWFGTAFSRLKCAERLTPIFQGVLSAEEWKDREGYLSEAYGTVAERHNAMGISGPLSTELTSFFDRPYRVLFSGRFVDALRNAITDTEVLALPPHLGSINQITDSTDALDNGENAARFKALYG